MNARFQQSQRTARGFTLLELLLSLALVAMLLVAMNAFIFSMGELWGKGGDERLFDRHVRTVTRYVEAMMRSSVLPPTSLIATDPAAPREVKPDNGLSGDFLTFELPEGTRVLAWPERPLPDVVCSLAVRPNDGLVLYWHSRLETKFADDPPRVAVISPYVTAISYDYYDPDFKHWTNEPIIKKDANGQLQAPTRIRLKFAYEKFTRETVIDLPTYNGTALPSF